VVSPGKAKSLASSSGLPGSKKEVFDTRLTAEPITNHRCFVGTACFFTQTFVE
jgi:hypothetical protein